MITIRKVPPKSNVSNYVKLYMEHTYSIDIYLGLGLLALIILVLKFIFRSCVVHYVLAYALEVSKTV